MTEIKDLIELAKAASQKAHCIYSDFPVGAAIKTECGQIFVGCNVENASYGLSSCAERNGIFQMVVASDRDQRPQISKVVIYAPKNKREIPTPPCGACRQVIYEFGKDADVYATCQTGEIKHWKICELLPDAFGPEDLDSKH